MKIDREKIMRCQMSQTVQNIFFSVRVKDYFAVLEEMTGNLAYGRIVQKVMEYSELDDSYKFNFRKRIRNICEDVTVGEMLYAASRMLMLKNYGGDPDHPNAFERMVIRTGMMLVEELLVKPMQELENRRCKGLWPQTEPSDHDQAAV